MKQKLPLVALTLFVGCLVLAAGVVAFNKKAVVEKLDLELRQSQELSSFVPVKPVTSEDHIRGNPDAEVFVIEFADIECPACKIFHEDSHKILERYGDRVALVYRHFPLTSLHANAEKEAEAAECVADLAGNEAFWKFLDAVYKRTDSNDTLDLRLLPSLAEKAGADRNKFVTCLQERMFEPKIKSHILDGVHAGVTKTPSVVIWRNGKGLGIIRGSSYERTVVALDRVLQDGTRGLPVQPEISKPPDNVCSREDGCEE